ncbi:hypothetical protein [Pantoea vagans]|uniref:hypothetical protein n=1 Tax=Pantoea vagans TaxID=470934 RepID=UPI00069FFCA2|nr:hypothetical protein [Pantoea vagans]DAL13961.1 MAG TPA_asm: hypothetical protein [Caudoviricetes sp.]
MNQSEIEHMAQGLPPSHIGKDHEEVVIWLATQLLDVQKKLGVAIKRGDACMQAEIVWEKAMMAAIGEDGVGCVVKAIAALKAERDALAAENAALKSGPHGFFAYGGECGYEEFKTAEEAREFADEEIASYREQACDGWSDEVSGVVWGVVMQRATMTGLRPVEEGDNCAEGFTEWCDYTLLPNVETPATDAYLKAIRAEGVEMLAKQQRELAALLEGDAQRSRQFIACRADDFAAQLRAEGIIMFASKQLSAAGDLESKITLERLMLDAEEFAGQLRAGKDGE